MDMGRVFSYSFARYCFENKIKSCFYQGDYLPRTIYGRAAYEIDYFRTMAGVWLKINGTHTHTHSNRGVSSVSRCAADLEIAERL